jgi:uncharacterized lipoprotein YmbA
MRLIILVLALILTGCATAGVSKTWHVHPDNMQQFQTDRTRCTSFALAVGGPNIDDVFDFCLQQAGYRLEVSN